MGLSPNPVASEIFWIFVNFVLEFLREYGNISEKIIKQNWQKY